MNIFILTLQHAKERVLKEARFISSKIVSDFVSKNHSLLHTASIAYWNVLFTKSKLKCFTVLLQQAWFCIRLQTSFAAIFWTEGVLERSRPSLSPHHTSLKSSVGVSPPILFCALVIMYNVSITFNMFRFLAIWAGSGLSSSCSSSRICKLRDAIMLVPVKAETGTDAIFTSGVHSPLDEEWRSIAVTFFPPPLPHTNESRLMDRTWK